jgi:hypothetical protein
MKRKFMSALRKKVVNVGDIWFQQDGAAPYQATGVLAWLEETFGQNFISLKTAIKCPPHSPDLSPLDFFLWGYLKDRVYKHSPKTTDDLKAVIKREIRNISSDTCASVIRNFQHRLDVVIEQKKTSFRAYPVKVQSMTIYNRGKKS